jgi:transcriptional regulator GlxA family with amidase domain
MDRRRVGILVYPEVEILDFCGPFEVFSVVRLEEEQRRTQTSPYTVLLIAQMIGTVHASGGLRVLPDYDFATCPPLDILLVPGGWGSRVQAANGVLMEWLRGQAAEVKTLAAVCTGSMLLGQAGLLDGHRATTHWRSLDRMTALFPEVEVERQQHVVADDKLITSAGISAGIDLALRIVARDHGEAIARAAARHMEYPYPENNDRRV